jgi:hypothetical protein
MKKLFNFVDYLLIALIIGLGALLGSAAQAQAIGDYAENQIIDTIFRAQATSLGANVFVGLSTAACSDASVGTEVTGGSYARVSVARSLANWAGTQGAGTTTASTGTGGATSNNVAINFVTPTASWGTVVSAFITDALTGNNIISCTTLTINKTINSGDAVAFPAAALTFTIN